MHYPLISNNFLEGYQDLLAERGLSALDNLRRVGLTPDVLRLPDMLIPFDQHNRLLMLAAEQLQCPHFGLELARRQGLTIFGPLSYMIAKCSRVGEALKLFEHHLSILVQTVDFSISVHGQLAHLIIRSDFTQVAKTVTFQTHGLALSYDLIRLLSGSHWSPRAAYFPHSEPANTQTYADFFHCPLGFNHSELALVFDYSLLDQPLHEEANLLPQRLRHYLEHRHENDLLRQVKQIIALTLAADDCELGAVAQAMGYSRRTLQRRLGEAGTSFQGLVDEVRHHQATSYLSHPYYRLTDIAAMLGYSELSAFTRSFKRWYGQSPNQWRKTH